MYKTDFKTKAQFLTQLTWVIILLENNLYYLNLSRYELKFGLKFKIYHFLEMENVKDLQHDNLNFHIQSQSSTCI